MSFSTNKPITDRISGQPSAIRKVSNLDSGAKRLESILELLVNKSF